MDQTNDIGDAARSAIEQRALSVGKWGNLFMGVAGVIAAWLSHSQALLMDGLFSAIGFVSAVLAARVSLSASLPPDDRRPLGYAADESIYKMFRSLSLICLVVFATANALLNIVAYASGDHIPELQYGPIIVYFVVIIIACTAIAANHHFAWKKTGSRSDVLKLETRAAVFDGMVTLAAAIGLGVMPFLKGGPMGWIAPIGDSVIVLFLCSLVAGRYWSDFKAGLGELAGVSAAKGAVSTARRVLSDIAEKAGGTLVDLSVLKLGRQYQVVFYFAPGTAISAAEADALSQKCQTALAPSLGQAVVAVLITKQGRHLGQPASNAE